MKTVTRRRLKDLLILIFAAIIVGGILLVSGVVPIKASSGHWAITRWMLDFASNRSVSFHSSITERPKVDQIEELELGAATYDSNCRWCHGAPGFPKPTVAAKMTPAPPNLAVAVKNWDDEELFYILKHGIKFAGMPAWAAEERDSEIWPVVDFLRALPSMDGPQYLSLITVEHVEQDTISVLVSQQCAACHGIDGTGRAGQSVPIIAGQKRAYLINSLVNYRNGTRHSGVMEPIAGRLTEPLIQQLADYFANSNDRLAVEDPEYAINSTDNFETGRQLAMQGEKRDKIASCVDCHGPPDLVNQDGISKAMTGNEEYPSLAGQHADYIRQQLKLFQDRLRGGKLANLMHPIASKLTPSQIDALATYYSNCRDDNSTKSE